MYPIKTDRKCTVCGKMILLVGEQTEQVEGQYSPVTTSFYECSDTVCSDNTKRHLEQKTKLRLNQELERKKRREARRNMV